MAKPLNVAKPGITGKAAQLRGGNPKKNVMYPGKPSQPSRMTTQYGTGSAKDNMTYNVRGSASSVGTLDAKDKPYKGSQSTMSKGKGNPQKDMTSTGMGKRKITPGKLEQS